MVTHALCLDAFWLVTCQVVHVYKIWIQLHWEWLVCRNNHRLKWYPFAKIVPNTKKNSIYSDFYYKFVVIKHLPNNIRYLLRFWVINSRGSGFITESCRVAVIWFQKYQRSDLKRGSISMARQIVKWPRRTNFGMVWFFACPPRGPKP
jgi:hypothetical protein